MANPGDDHWQALKRTPRYLKGTSALGIRFRIGISPSKQKLCAYADDEYANDTTHRKSITGYVIFFAGVSIIWKTTKQSCVTLSSTESELVAASAAAVRGEFPPRTLRLCA
ncbi:MAG: hypothetical protein BJ554DRAFT_5006 [Olpidium bornovanus]|uniref:Uncharacterized protein n=1 Tax=Olpidium bornovanus TaxID=278681 RepID=A0A8H8A025_9FUNG|nr:MAG: hypothetical protein BJ554DRAFT_5006 [Olpidium bornovanus]